MKTVALIAAGILAAASASAFAHSNDARQTEQWNIIEQGRNDGSITWREGLKLRRQQAEIARIEAEMKADGRLSRAEKRLLHRRQDQAQNNIVREASDGWQRPWWLRRFGF
jgi:ferredoxin-NADP reductase